VSDAITTIGAGQYVLRPAEPGPVSPGCRTVTGAVSSGRTTRAYAAGVTAPVKVGVQLPPSPGDLGEWLADGSSFEAAGAHALWVRPSGPDLDPLALTAALAAVTARALLVTTVAGEPSRTLATLDRLSRGRVRVLGEAAVAGLGFFRRVPAEPDAYEHLDGAGEPERWLRVPSPDGRAGWQASLLDAARRGCRGLVVPAGPRLLDILRNPEDPGQRHDLQLAQG